MLAAPSQERGGEVPPEDETEGQLPKETTKLENEGTGRAENESGGKGQSKARDVVK